MSTVAIVDYGLCNLDSVRRAVEECGGRPLVTAHPDAIVQSSHVILPGVGAFPEAMNNLRRSGLVDALQRQVVEKGAPFLGICLGMQLLATRGFEVCPTDGLGWIEGEVRRLEPEDGARVPHVGWNELQVDRPARVLEGIPDRTDFYFVHSYALSPVHSSDVAGRTPFGSSLVVTAVERDNITGVQFHPEKSQRLGFRVIQNFLTL
jgi:imidazole glycerol-phosphate synthase subunit HisH